MPRNGSGVMSRTNGVHTGSTLWVEDRDSSDNILAARHDTQDQDLANEITNSIAKDGQTAITADLPMSGFKHSNVANASLRTHYAATGQAQDNALTYGGISTGAVNVYAISLTPAISAYVSGQLFTFEAHSNNTGSCTLNVNAVGAKPLFVHGQGGVNNPASGTIQPGTLVVVLYKSAGGGSFEIVGAMPKNLEEIGRASNADGNFLVGNGSAFVTESGVTARASMSAAKSGINSDILNLTGCIAHQGNSVGSVNFGNSNPAGPIGFVWNNTLLLLASAVNFAPNADGGLNLGESSRRWAGGWFSGVLTAATVNAVTVNSTTVNIGLVNTDSLSRVSGDITVGKSLLPNNTGTLTLGNTALRYLSIWSNSFLPFTGCHYTESLSDPENVPDIGDAVALDNNGSLRLAKKGEARVAGIFQSSREEDVLDKNKKVVGTKTIYIFAAVGDNYSDKLKGFNIALPENYRMISAGTALRVSSVDGLLEPQDDDIIRTTTVGKTFVDAWPDSDSIARNVYGAIFAG